MNQNTERLIEANKQQIEIAVGDVRSLMQQHCLTLTRAPGRRLRPPV